MTTEDNDVTNWGSGPLHSALVDALPIFVKEPFSDAPRLNIAELKKAIGKSHETVYKWLRTNRLNPRNAQKLFDLANSESNLLVLSKLGRTAPKIEDFTRFMMA